jgi:hypothetical protein
MLIGYFYFALHLISQDVVYMAVPLVRIYFEKCV